MREIPLSRGAVAVVDDVDYARASMYKWSLDTNGYAVRAARVGQRRVKVMLHRFLLCAPRGMHVDHADHNPLNCTRANMRLATPSQNNANRPGRERTVSPYKGVSTYKGTRYRTEICVGGVRRHIGVYDCQIEAAKAYDVEALSAWGEFAHLNFPQNRNP